MGIFVQDDQRRARAKRWTSSFRMACIACWLGCALLLPSAGCRESPPSVTSATSKYQPADNVSAPRRAPPPTRPQRDAYNDELPRFASKRFGSVRLLPIISVSSVAVAPNGTAVATVPVSGSFGAVEIWDAGTGKRLGLLLPQADKTFGLAWSPDNHHLAIGYDGKLEIWNSISSKLLRAMEMPKDARCDAGNLCWSADEQHIACVDVASVDSSRVFVWDASTGKIVLQLDYPGQIHDVSFSHDSRQIVVGGPGVLELRDMNSQEVRRFDCGDIRVWGASFSPDGTTLAVVYESEPMQSVLAHWNVASGAKLADLGNFPGASAQVAYSGDGTQIITGSLDKKLRIWNAATGELQKTITTPGLVGHVFDVAVDRQKIVSADRRIGIWDLKTFRLQNQPDGHPSNVFSFAIVNDGQKVVSCGGDGAVRVWDLNSNSSANEVLARLDTPLTSLAASPDESLLALGTLDGHIKLLDMHSREIRHVFTFKSIVEIDFPAGVSTMAFTADGDALLFGLPDGRVCLWDLRRQRVEKQWFGATFFPIVVRSPAGEQFVMGPIDGALQLWNSRTGQLRAIPESNSLFFPAAAFDPQGLCVYTATFEQRQVAVEQKNMDVEFKAVRCWDHQKEIDRWRTDWIPQLYCIAACPQGQLVAFGSLNKIHIVSASTGEWRKTLSGGHFGPVWHLEFTHNGKNLISSGEDGVLTVWDLEQALRESNPGSPWD